MITHAVPALPLQRHEGSFCRVHSFGAMLGITAWPPLLGVWGYHSVRPIDARSALSRPSPSFSGHMPPTTQTFRCHDRLVTQLYEGGDSCTRAQTSCTLATPAFSQQQLRRKDCDANLQSAADGSKDIQVSMPAHTYGDYGAVGTLPASHSTSMDGVLVKVRSPPCATVRAGWSVEVRWLLRPAVLQTDDAQPAASAHAYVPAVLSPVRT